MKNYMIKEQDSKFTIVIGVKSKFNAFFSKLCWPTHTDWFSINKNGDKAANEEEALKSFKTLKKATKKLKKLKKKEPIYHII